MRRLLVAAPRCAFSPVPAVPAVSVRRLARRLLSVAAAAFFIAAPSAGAEVWLPGASFAPRSATSSSLSPVERSVLRRINALRSINGVRPLRASAALTVAAREKAAEVQWSSHLEHDSEDGTPMATRLRRYVRARAVGETLGMLSPDTPDRAAAIVSMWMSSPTHRSTLLSPAYRRAGVALVQGERFDVVAVDLASLR